MTIRAFAFTFLLFIPHLSFATTYPESIVAPTTDPSLQVLGIVGGLPNRTVRLVKFDSNNNVIREMYLTAFILNDDAGKPLKMAVVAKKVDRAQAPHHPPIFEDTKIYAINPAAPTLPMVYFNDMHYEPSVDESDNGIAVHYIGFLPKLDNGLFQDFEGTLNVSLEEDANGALTGNIKVFHEVNLPAPLLAY